jgi:hypothetical protein
MNAETHTNVTYSAGANCRDETCTRAVEQEAMKRVSVSAKALLVKNEA